MKRTMTCLVLVVVLLLAAFAPLAQAEILFYETKDSDKWWVGIDEVGAFAGINLLNKGEKDKTVGGLMSTIVRCNALEVNKKKIPLALDFLLLSDIRTIKSLEDVDAGLGISSDFLGLKKSKITGKIEWYVTVGVGGSPGWFVGENCIFLYGKLAGKYGVDGPDIEKSANSSKEAAQFIAYVNHKCSTPYCLCKTQ